MDRKRTFVISAVMALSLVSCGVDSREHQASPSQDAALVEKIEKQVFTRKADLDLRRYVRLYSHDGPDNVNGTYFYEGIGGLPSKWRSGKRYWVEPNAIPIVSDGGCAVINVLYNIPSETLVFVSCNGDA